jgi:hypothetical protein
MEPGDLPDDWGPDPQKELLDLLSAVPVDEGEVDALLQRNDDDPALVSLVQQYRDMREAEAAVPPEAHDLLEELGYLLNEHGPGSREVASYIDEHDQVPGFRELAEIHVSVTLRLEEVWPSHEFQSEPEDPADWWKNA